MRSSQLNWLSAADAARAIRDGRAMVNPRSGPGYPLLLAAGTFLTDDLFVFGKVIASVSLAAAGWFTFLVVRALANAPAALGNSTGPPPAVHSA